MKNTFFISPLAYLLLHRMAKRHPAANWLCNRLQILEPHFQRKIMKNLLYIVAAIFIVFWVIGFVFRYIINPMVHLLLVAALIVIAVRFILGQVGGRRNL
jgi:hypothetical protein